MNSKHFRSQETIPGPRHFSFLLLCHIFSSLIKLEFGGGVYGAKCQSTQAYLQNTYLYFRQYRLNTRNTIPNRIPMDAAVEKTTNSSKVMICGFCCFANRSDGLRPPQSDTQKIKQLKCCFSSCSVSIISPRKNCKLVNMNQQSLWIIYQHLLTSAESCRLATSQLSQQCVFLVTFSSYSRRC